MFQLALALVLTATPQRATLSTELAPEPAAALPPEWCDYDGDGRLDVLRVSGQHMALLRNLGYGQFEDVTASVGLPSESGSPVVLWGDYDGDEEVDLLLGGGADGPRLFRQIGGTFQEASDALPLDGPTRVDGAWWLDVDGDGHLDLHLHTAEGGRTFLGTRGGTFEPVDLGELTVIPSTDADDPAPATGGAAEPDADVSDADVADLTDDGRKEGAAAAASGFGGAGDTGSSGSGSKDSVVTSNPAGGPELGSVACSPSLQDMGGGGCIAASSVPTLGMLYPMSESLNVDPVTGFVGIHKIDPDTPLHVVGNSRVVSNANMGGVGQGAFQITNFGYTQGLSFSAEGLQSVGTDLRVNPDNLHAFDVNGGALRVETTGRVGINKVPGVAIDLDVDGIVRAGDTIVSTKAIGAPFQIASTDLSFNLNADLLDGLDATAFSQFGTQVDGAELADGAVTDAKIAAGAGIAGTKIAPDFGSQDIVTDGRIAVGVPADYPLQVAGGGEVSGSGGGSLVVGVSNSNHLAIDGDEIQARSQTLFGLLAPTPLYLNPDGSGVHLGNATSIIDVPGRLEVGQFKLPPGAAPGRVLTSDAAGNASWQEVPGGGGPDGDWQIVGSDMYAGASGQVGIGLTSGYLGKLHVSGAGQAWNGYFEGAPNGIATIAEGLAIQANSTGPNGAGVYAAGEAGVVAVSTGDVYGALEARKYGAGPIIEGYNDAGSTPVFSVANDGSAVCTAIDVNNPNGPGIVALSDTGSTNTVLRQLGSGDLIAAYVGNSGPPVFEVDRDGIVLGAGLDVLNTLSGSAVVARADTPAAAAVVRQDGGGHILEARQGSVPVAWIEDDGRLVCSVLEITGGADLVESFETGGETYEPGSVLVIDSERVGHLTLAEEPYDAKVAGVVSGAGGVRPGIELAQADLMDGDTPVALTGRVWVRACTEGGAIRAGDMLTTSSQPGRAMRVDDPGRSQGAVIGKAMSELDEEIGLVLVLVNLQ